METSDEFHLLPTTIYDQKYRLLCLYKDYCLLKRKRITRNLSMSERILVFSGIISRDLHISDVKS